MNPVKCETLAGLLGLSTVAVAALARRGIVVKEGKGQFDAGASIRSYCSHLREAVSAQGRPASGTTAGRARLAKAQAEAVELKNARQRGELLPAEAIAREWEGICRTIRAGMLRVPKRAAARLPHLTPQDVHAIDSEVRAALTVLAADPRSPKKKDANDQ